MKNVLKFISFIAVIAVTISSCEDELFDVDSIEFIATPTTVKVGEPVIFHASSGAIGYVIFPGDEGHIWEESAAMKVGENEIDSIYRTVDPFIQRFEEDLTEATEIPESIGGGDKITLIGLEDGAAKFNISSPGWGNDLLIRPNVGIGSDATILNLKMKFVNADPNLQIRFTTTVKINGTYTQWTWGGGRIYPTYAANGEYTNIQIDLAGLIDSWRKNSGKEYGKLEEVKIALGGGPPSNRYTGDFYLQSASIGIDGYFQFDTGLALDAFASPIKLSYIYETPGTYEAILVINETSRKKYNSGGYTDDRAGELNINEFDSAMDTKKILITVTE